VTISREMKKKREHNDRREERGVEGAVALGSGKEAKFPEKKERRSPYEWLPTRERGEAISSSNTKTQAGRWESQRGRRIPRRYRKDPARGPRTLNGQRKCKARKSTRKGETGTRPEVKELEW